MKRSWPAGSFALVAGLLLASVPISAQVEDVDEIADLSALVLADASNQGTVYTTAAEQSENLAALEAVPIAGGRYELELEGEQVQVSVVLTPLPALYLPADDVLAKPKVGKVFRNARCVLTIPAFITPCVGFNYQWTIYQTQPIHRCKRPGTERCVEKKKVAWTRSIFSDPNCSNLIALQSKKKNSCQ